MRLKIQKNEKSAIFIVSLPDSVSPKSTSHSWTADVQCQNGAIEKKTFRFIGDGRSLLIGTRVVRLGPPEREPFFSSNKETALCTLQHDGFVRQQRVLASIVRPVAPKISKTAPKGGGKLLSAMGGKVVSVFVKERDTVKKGETLLIIEAMKMENRIVADCDGIVETLRISLGDQIAAGQCLLVLEPTDPKTTEST